VPNEPLKDILVNQIRRDGPIDLATYMQIALSHPEYGYYWAQESIGAKGDFTTAPEISQLFGEMIGLWIIDCWHQMGSPATINIIEPGPGRGTLMADIVRTIAKASNMTPEVHLIETSPRLTDIQQETLKAHWHPDLSTVPAGPFILVANEFLDALPIRQFEMTKDGWAEVYIEATEDGDLKRGLRPSKVPALAAAPANFSGANPGDIVETCPAAAAFMTEIATRLNHDGGVALFLDYGYGTAAFGDSLQALFDGDYADPLDQPGGADITAHVNFASLLNIAKNCGAYGFGPIEQGKFLEQLGLFVRADALKLQASGSQRSLIDLAVHRLTAQDQMGSLFKALAFVGNAELQPAGFAP
jgi:NADH dehydrogenase [ubiquinone] 1 alpha subcomplex assembly factor 7